MSLQDKASIIWPKGAPYKAGNLAAWNPQGQSLVEFDVVRATQKWRINEAGTWEALAANVIARDFTNSGCGDYNNEPARKNLFLNSTTGVTQSITVVSGVDYAVSFSGIGSITFSGGATGTLSGTGATPLDRVSEIKTTTTTSITCTISGTVEYVNFEINTDDSSVTYPTSWIETAGSIVTRNDDEVSLSNASALLGQQSGSIYVEFEASESVEFIKINSKIFIYITPAGQVRGTIFQDGTKTVNGSTVGFNQKTKVCLRYQSGNTTIFTNGVKGGTTATPYLFDAELNNITIGSSGFFTAAKEAFKYSEAVVFKEVITDEQAIELTTP